MKMMKIIYIQLLNNSLKEMKFLLMVNLESLDLLVYLENSMNIANFTSPISFKL